MSRGRMPPEARDRLFEQVARLEVQTAGGNEPEEDVLRDYFGDANELLIAHREQLPPLFRDYARGYFDSIRPEETEQRFESTADRSETTPVAKE